MPEIPLSQLENNGFFLRSRHKMVENHHESYGYFLGGKGNRTFENPPNLAYFYCSVSGGISLGTRDGRLEITGFVHPAGQPDAGMDGGFQTGHASNISLVVRICPAYSQEKRRLASPLAPFCFVQVKSRDPHPAGALFFREKGSDDQSNVRGFGFVRRTWTAKADCQTQGLRSLPSDPEL